MRAAVGQTNGLVLSSAVLADLLQSGVEREKAYRAVQTAANRTVDLGEDFEKALSAQGINAPDVRPERFLVHHDVILKRLEALRELED
jgi:adenylosuccinate lyase